MIVGLDSGGVSTWKRHSDAQVGIWLRLKKEEKWRRWVSLSRYEQCFFFRPKTSFSLKDVYLFIDDEWCWFRVLLWTLNLTTCVTHHSCTRGGEYDLGNYSGLICFLTRMAFERDFLGLMDCRINSPSCHFYKLRKNFFLGYYSPRIAWVLFTPE